MQHQGVVEKGRERALAGRSVSLWLGLLGLGRKFLRCRKGLGNEISVVQKKLPQPLNPHQNNIMRHFLNLPKRAHWVKGLRRPTLLYISTGSIGEGTLSLRKPSHRDNQGVGNPGEGIKGSMHIGGGQSAE